MPSCLRCSRPRTGPEDWFCEFHAAQVPPRRCGWGGARDDPAPCPALTRAGHWLCDRHSAIVGRLRPDRKRTIRVGQGAPVTVRHEPPTRCRRGHELTPANTYTDPNGARVCRTCRAEREAARRARQRAQRPPRDYGVCSWRGCQARLTHPNAKVCPAHRAAHRPATIRVWHQRRSQRAA
jgi:hypothetical protein